MPLFHNFKAPYLKYEKFLNEMYLMAIITYIMYKTK